MRHTPLLLVLVVLLGALTAPAWGQTLSVCDYVAPSNELVSMMLSGGYQQFDDRYADDRGNVNNGNFLLKGLNWIDGPEWGFRVEGSAGVQFSSTSVDFAYSLDTNSDFRRYLSQDFFLFGGMDTSGTPAQEGLSVKALAGAGLGRFQNVSPMAKTFAIVNLLKTRGVLSAIPDNQNLMDIAQAIEGEGQGLSAVLLKALEDHLGVTLELPEVLAINEALSGNLTRYCGWDATASLGYEVISPTDSNSLLLRAATNYATSPDPNSQLLATGRFSAMLPWTGGYMLSGSMQYNRSLSPTTRLDASYNYSAVGNGMAADTTLKQTHVLGTTVNMQVAAALSVLFKGQVTLSTGFEQPEWELNISFQYSLF